MLELFIYLNSKSGPFFKQLVIQCFEQFKDVRMMYTMGKHLKVLTFS